MRISRLAAIVISLVIGTVTACGDSPQINSAVPTNIKELQAKEPGKSLMKYGYTPVAYLFNHAEGSRVVGEAYVHCGTTIDLTECSNDLHNRGTHERPNVYVIGDKVAALEGPHDSSIDTRSYYGAVPKSHQNFGGLTEAEQKKLLGIMPTIAKAVGHPSGSGMSSVQTAIGAVDAWVSKTEPEFTP